MAEAVAAAVATPQAAVSAEGGESIDSAIDKAQGTEKKGLPKYGKYGEPLREEVKEVESTASEKLKPDLKKEPKTGSETEPKKKAILVDGKEVVLDDDSLLRFAQKGAAADKRLFQLSQEKKQVTQLAQKADEMMQKATGILEMLSKDPIGAMQKILGDETKVREAVEPFLAQRIREELEDEKNPYSKALREEKKARELAESRWKEHEETQKNEEQKKQHEGLVTHFNKQIIAALETSNLPKNDRTAAKMADHMYRAAKRNIEYKPEEIANLVKEDYIEDIGFFTGEAAKSIETAHKANDVQTLLKFGEQLEGILGKSVAMALRRFDLAKLKSGQPTLPKPVVETPRAAQKESSKRQYMTEEEYAAERKRRAQAIDRGEAVSDW